MKPADDWRRTSTRCAALALAAACALTAAGCMSIDEMAPPVAGPVAQAAARRGVDLRTAMAGRQVYLEQCSRCHTIEPIGRYSASKWRSVLPEMAIEARLGDEQLASLRAYVLTAREVIAEQGGEGQE